MSLTSQLHARKEAAAPQGADGVSSQPETGRSVNLTKRLVTHKGEVSTILLREPTLSDYIALGDIDTPVATDFGEDSRPTKLRTETDYAALMGWAAALSGLDRHILGRLSPRDSGELLEQVRLAVMPFTKTKDHTKGNSSSEPTS